MADDIDNEVMRLGQRALRVGRKQALQEKRTRELDNARRFRLGAAVMAAIARGDTRLGQRIVVLCNAYFDRKRDREILGLPEDPKQIGQAPGEFFGGLMAAGEAATQERAAAAQTAPETTAASKPGSEARANGVGASHGGLPKPAATSAGGPS